MDNCQHLSLVIDEHEGTEICIDCAKVVSDLICMPAVQLDQQFECSVEPEKEICLLKKTFLESISALNLSYSLVDKCLNEYKKICSIEKCKKDLAAYVLYYVLLKSDTPHSIKEITAVTGISTNIIWKIQSELQQTKVSSHSYSLQPIDLLNRACTYLNMNYTDVKRIQSRLNKLKQKNFNPATVVGAHIYKYCKENNLKQITLKEVSKTVGISVMSIQRYLKRNE